MGIKFVQGNSAAKKGTLMQQYTGSIFTVGQSKALIG